MLIERIETDHDGAHRAIMAVIERHNDAITGRPEPARHFAVLVRDSDGTVLGGALAMSYYDWVFVDLLVLPAEMRGGGIGTRVMRTVEREAVRHGCRGVWLATMSYQAPGFYKRLGFTEFARIEDYGPGETHYWFLKTPLEDFPDQGLPVTDTPSDAEKSVLGDTLGAYNEARSGPRNLQHVTIVVRASADGPIEGGLSGRISRGWLFVALLALPESMRRQRVGTRLMEAAEAAARAAGCRGIWLDTFSFQARPFYERLGFTVIGEIADYPAPHRRWFLAKRLDAAPPVTEGAAAQPMETE